MEQKRTVFRKPLSEQEQNEVNNALHMATLNNDIEGVVEALKNGAEVNTPIHSVSNDLNYNTNPHSADGYFMTPLMFAIEMENIDMVRAVLKFNPDVNLTTEDGDNALSYAIRDDRIDILDILLNAGANPNVNRGFEKVSISPIVYASLNGSTEMVKMLIEHGADPNERDLSSESGNTALMVATNAQTAQILLQAGANVGAQDTSEKTVLLRRIHSMDIELLELLLSCGADPNVPDKDGNTALMEAAVHGNTKVIDLLLRFGADVHARNRRGDTAFLLATGSLHHEDILALYNAGADTNDVNSHTGETAILRAINQWNPKTLIPLMFTMGIKITAEDAEKIMFTADKNDYLNHMKSFVALLLLMATYPDKCKSAKQILAKDFSTGVNAFLSAAIFSFSVEFFQTPAILNGFAGVLSEGEKKILRIEEHNVEIMSRLLCTVMEENPSLGIKIIQKRIGKQLDSWVKENVPGSDIILSRMLPFFNDLKRKPGSKQTHEPFFQEF